ncbi:putative methyltransferase [Rubellimicrobium mesophilum DSM 19309]|uniref:Putative methyltransferase n=1 Tax=Rubellimicrobium mesophilum DSM 19309 TaxID=442562 RepID=A0A017HNK7_9RHOB|nr:bifunctional glycosyltransferase/class I SAM-dependent methyltransferase [Rubellimicrobium mesophilum]EYD75956.1 putative methyltransferase [Rubellimicrobium mesophilum DSM 19309]
MTRVSAVINIYEEDPTLISEAIASIRAQTRPADEIIVVQDGMHRDYSALFARHPDLTLLRQENMGLAAARNTGLRAATGDMILFLDGDDRLMPEAIAVNLAQLEGEPGALMAFGGWRFIEADGTPLPQIVMPPLGEDPVATLLRGNCIGMHSTVLYRRSALLAEGGFAPDFRACEDYELYLRMARRGPILATGRLLAEYRQHGGNMSSDHPMMMRTALRVLAAQEPHLAGRPDWAAARRQGIAAWKVHYARQQYADILKAARGQAPAGRVLRSWLRMTRAVPWTMGKVVMSEILSRIRAAIRTDARQRPVDHVDWGQLRRTTPVSPWFGFDRGLPVDRRYIEGFLTTSAGDIRGRVLEVGDNAYTLRFGGDRVTASEVLHVDPEAPGVTYVADLADGAGLPDNAFDCIVLTQTLHLIYDMPAAIRTIRRILAPGGVLLLTVPGVSSVDQGEWGGTWFWSLTAASLGRLLSDAFQVENVSVETHGNVLVATAFLHGLAASELTDEEFAVADPNYPVIVTARARKA